MESNRSIEDIKDAGEQPIVAVEQPKETKSQTKTLRPSTLKNSQEPPKTKKTKGELISIIQKYNEGKPNNEKITGYSRMQISQLLRLMVNRGLIKQGGGAKTRKQKNRKTRKRGMRKTRR